MVKKLVRTNMSDIWPELWILITILIDSRNWLNHPGEAVLSWSHTYWEKYEMIYYWDYYENMVKKLPHKYWQYDRKNYLENIIIMKLNIDILWIYRVIRFTCYSAETWVDVLSPASSSCYRLWLPHRKCVVYLTFSGQLFHHIPKIFSKQK